LKAVCLQRFTLRFKIRTQVLHTAFETLVVILADENLVVMVSLKVKRVHKFTPNGVEKLEGTNKIQPSVGESMQSHCLTGNWKPWATKNIIFWRN